jgi:hypothetical protein
MYPHDFVFQRNTNCHFRHPMRRTPVKIYLGQPRHSTHVATPGCSCKQDLNDIMPPRHGRQAASSTRASKRARKNVTQGVDNRPAEADGLPHGPLSDGEPISADMDGPVHAPVAASKAASPSPPPKYLVVAYDHKRNVYLPVSERFEDVEKLSAEASRALADAFLDPMSAPGTIHSPAPAERAIPKEAQKIKAKRQVPVLSAPTAGPATVPVVGGPIAVPPLQVVCISYHLLST